MGWYCGDMIGYVDAFEEAGLLREFVGVLDSIDSALAAVERCRPPSVIEWFYDVGVSKVKIGYPKYIAQENETLITIVSGHTDIY